MNKVEQWKAHKHGFDVWPDVLRHAEAKTPMKDIDEPDLERMKWHGFFYRKRDTPGTYMQRIRLTGCELNSAQAKEIAYLAYEFGYGIVDITTRANIQVQGFPIEHVPKAAARLETCGLTSKQTGHDNIRNVFCHPLSGVDPDELIDTRPLCHELAALFLGCRAYADLPRKFNIAVSGREPHGLTYWTQDISFLACRSTKEEVLFQVLIGGTQGQNPCLGWHLPVLAALDQVAPVTAALLDLFRERGSREKRDRARFRYLIEQIGVGGVLKYLEEHLDFRLRPCVVPPSPPSGYDELVGWFRQKQPDRWAMGLCVPLGRLSWQQLEGLAVLAKRWGDGSLRTTHEQGILILNIPTGFKDAAATDAARYGLSINADTLALNTVACTGRQFCNIAVTETKGQMFQLIEKLRQRGVTLHGIRIHMSGCPSSCAQHHTADIGLKGVRVRRLLGTREGYDVYLGGGVAGQVHLGMPYRLGVDVDQLPQLIEEVVREYYLKHHAGQTFSAFWRERLRDGEAAKVGDSEYTPPRWLCEGCGYEHRGEDPPVFCPGCAGLRRLFARVEEAEARPTEASPTADPHLPVAPEGFVFAAREELLSSTEGLGIEIQGHSYALFRINGEIVALDGECPHAGGPLAQGTLTNGVLTCPWHHWEFDVCTGCSLKPRGKDLQAHECQIVNGNIFIKL
jgi:ferredoxin-nitrite reductase